MKEGLKKFLPIALVVFFIVFSMWPTVYEWQNRGNIKPIRYFELVHNFPTDYNLYLSKIRQGKEGAWLASEKYTAEPHDGSLSQILYVFIGKVSDWAHVQTPYVWFSYHVMRVFFGALLLWIMWKLCQWVFPTFTWQIITFVLATTASTWPKFETVDGWPRFGGYMPWYTVVDSMQRTTFLPHVMLGQVILAFIIWVFAGGFVTKKHPGNWFFLGIVGIVVGIIFPPVILFMYGVLGFLTLAEVIPFIKNKELGTLPKRPSKIFVSYLKQKLFGRVVFGLLTFPTLVYFALLTTEYPWKRLAEFDVLHPTKFSYIEYFLALGATLPLGMIGSILVYLTPKHPLSQKLRIFSHWVWAWLFFVFLFNFIPAQSPTRWSEMSPHIPLSILTVYAVIVVSSGVWRIIKKKLAAVKAQDSGEPAAEIAALKVVHYGLLLIPLIIILFGLGTMFSSWLWQKDFVDHKLRADYPLVPEGSQVMYPLKDIVDAMMWLQINTPRSAVVLSGMATGNLIPVYAGNTTMVGHANTVDSENKVIAIANFFGRKRPMQEFVDWFKKYKVEYIFYGPAEAEQAYGAFDLTEFYPFLQEVYKNNMVIVYKVNLPQ